MAEQGIDPWVRVQLLQQSVPHLPSKRILDLEDTLVHGSRVDVVLF